MVSRERLRDFVPAEVLVEFVEADGPTVSHEQLATALNAVNESTLLHHVAFGLKESAVCHPLAACLFLRCLKGGSCFSTTARSS